MRITSYLESGRVGGRSTFVLSLALACSLLVVGAAFAVDDAAHECEARQNTAAADFAACLAKAQARYALDGDAAALNDAASACSTALAGKWQELEEAAVEAGAACPGTPNAIAAGNYVQACVDELATALHGGTLRLDVRTCNTALPTCNEQLAACTANRAALPATGQVTSYGAASDGVVRAGSRLSYRDNGDGTITDEVTGLMWEKKDDTGGVHGRHRTFNWFQQLPPTDPGTITTEFLPALNSGGGFAGHTDWRIPNIKELVSIVDYEIAASGPTVDRAFHARTCAGCSDVTLPGCSCTGESFQYAYCSSTFAEGSVRVVRFERGEMRELTRHLPCLVRAVRGGL